MYNDVKKNFFLMKKRVNLLRLGGLNKSNYGTNFQN